MTPKERAAVSIQNESETVSSLSMMRTAMQQALEALEEIAATRYPSNWCEALHDEITALREALMESNISDHKLEQEPILLSPSCAERGCACFDDRVDGEPVTAYLAPVQPVMQEPVACYEITQREDGEGFVVPTDEVYGLVCCDCGLSHDVVWSYDKETNELGMAAKRNDEATKQRRNAAPVRTKDLTDDEIRFWIGRFPFLLNEKSEKWVIGLARAVIAADREKNK